MRSRGRLGDRRGQVLPIVGVAVVGMVGMAALVVDLGFLYVARAEAQRTADASALAGAVPLITTPGNRERAARVATTTAARNTIRGTPVTLLAEDVTVTDSSVTVRVLRNSARGNALPTRFGGILGVRSVGIAATATAEAVPAGSATCFKPFIVPDLWVDANGNGQYDTGEYYDRLVTGYGTDYRKDGFVRDLGRPITLYPGSPNAAMVSSWYFLVRMPGNEGGDDIRRTIASTTCNPTVMSVTELRDVDRESGAKKGPVRQGIDDLIAADPNAYWDATTRTVRGSRLGDEAWRASPRVINIILFDPREPVDPGARPIRITNFATVFLERTAGSDQIVGRFLPTVGFSRGGNCQAANTCAAFAKRVRLVQ